ncbi:MAG: helix-turn-helix domain-containing protein, partial [Candidatus Cryptobacteroides sp.]
MMNTRLKQFMAAENITQAQLADSLKVVRASVSHILSGRNNPSCEFIKALMSTYPNLNIEWLMLGKGKMYKKEKSDDSLFLYDEADNQDSGTLSQSAAQELPNIESTIDFTSLGETMQVPVNKRKVIKVTILFDDGTYQVRLSENGNRKVTYEWSFAIDPQNMLDMICLQFEKDQP